jgi:hypothetical protein
MGGSAVRIYRAYIAAFPKARTSAEKLVMIDQLVHAFHYSLRQKRTFRPVGQQLIAGSAEQVLAFLDQLSQVDYATATLNESHAEWRRTVEQAADELRFLGEQLAWARGRPQADA